MNRLTTEQKLNIALGLMMTFLGWTLAVMFASVVFFGIKVARSDEVVIKLPSEKTLKVIYQAARRFDVDAQDLIKIAYTESTFKEDARRVNPNGTVDYGMFQINSVHWTTTCKYFDVFTLKGNALCAAKLVKAVKEYAEVDDAWIGRYHSKTPSLKVRYAKKLNEIKLGENK